MTLSIFRPMAFARLANYLISACVLGSVMLASGQDQAVRAPARLASQEHSQIQAAVPSAITLDPPTGWDLQVHAFDAHGNPLPEAPANFRHLGEAKAGEAGDVHTLTLRFSQADTLLHIKSTPDFRIEQGGSCVEGGSFAADTTCTLLVRFTPQGPGNRLGHLLITHSASGSDPVPMAFGLGGSSYSPVISFIPSTITTVPGSYPSSVGLLNAAQNLTIDGGDTMWIADSGNDIIRQLDSGGAFKTLATTATNPLGVAVDTFGEVYFDEPSANTMHEVYDYGPVVQVNGTGTTSCPASTPCNFSSEAISTPGMMSMDPYNHLFFVDSHMGYAMGTMQPIPAQLIFLYDPFPYQTNPASAAAVDASDNIYSVWNNGGECEIVQSSLYNAENSNVIFNKIAGGHTCGFSGDGGLAGNAEINSPIGQIVFDAAGNLYFSDTSNQRVRRIDYDTGIIRTIAGDGTAGYTGDGGKATLAELHTPTGVAVNSQGNVYIISSAATGQVIRKVGSPGQLAFGNQTKGVASAAQLVTVTNTGNSDMTLTNVVITGANTGDFKIDNTTTTCVLTSGALMYAGQTCRIGVIFTPSGTGARSATLTLLDNTTNGADSVTLGGTGVLPTPTFKITTPANGASFTSGTAVTFSVSVTSTSGAQPTGTVQFKVDGANYGSAATLSGTGTASTSVTGLTTTTHTLSATYSGSSSYAAAGPISVSITVKAAAIVEFTAPSAAHKLSPANNVTLAVTVKATEGPVPTGSVKFSVDGKSVATSTIVLGKASVNAGALAAGHHILMAAYSGNEYHPESTVRKRITVSP
ncbi:MAG: Ig-like domain repeat protein [Candidatus Sulfotelmatobacter sp.]